MTTKKANRWLDHVRQYRAQHEGMTWKDALKQASATYEKAEKPTEQKQNEWVLFVKEWIKTKKGQGYSYADALRAASKHWQTLKTAKALIAAPTNKPRTRKLATTTPQLPQQSEPIMFKISDSTPMLPPKSPDSFNPNFPSRRRMHVPPMNIRVPRLVEIGVS